MAAENQTDLAVVRAEAELAAAEAEWVVAIAELVGAVKAATAEQRCLAAVEAAEKVKAAIAAALARCEAKLE